MRLSESISGLLSHQFTEKVGWTLLHSLWQCCAILIIVGLLLMIFRRSSANAHYLVSCIGLLLMALLPIATFFLQSDRNDHDRESAHSPDAIVNSVHSTTGEVTPPSSINPIDVAVTVQPHEAANPMGTTTEAEAAGSRERTKLSRDKSILSRLEATVKPWLASITWFWLSGIVVLSLRLIASWRQVHQLQTTGVRLADAIHTSLLHSLSEKLDVRQLVRLLESSLVEVPTVIGWLKPVILLPIASISSLMPSQLEAILLHELAHIRRADYAVNMLQSVIETLLFYHPAVWWLSARIRQEREYCCDDLATSVCGNRVEYVAALVRMEELRCPSPAVALSARGGNLLSRVRRLVVPQAHDRLSTWWLSGTFALLFVAGVVALPARSTSETVVAAADESRTKSNAEVAGKTKDEKKRSNEPSDDLTPAQIADRIEESWKRYDSVEYSAISSETRNANTFAAEPKPILVKLTGEIHYRASANRWFVHEKTQIPRMGSTELSPRETIAAFDGTTHSVLEGSKLVIGEEDLANERFKPSEFFWKAGLSRGWLLAALRRPEARIVEHIHMAEISCLNIKVQWKPTWDTMDRKFDITICPEQGWLPRRVIIERGDELVAEWSIPSVNFTESGLCFPSEMRTIRPESDDTPRRSIKVTDFRERTDLTAKDFSIPIPPGIDIVDHRQGFAWHNDPWWDELSPWISENVTWPLPDLQPLHQLGSHCDPEVFGKAAPPLNPSEWINGPGVSNWDRPDRKLTIVYFFGGRLITPTPRELKSLDNLYQIYRTNGLEVIGVATHNDAPELTRQAVKELRISFPVMIDSKETDTNVTSGTAKSNWGATFAAFRQKSYSGTLMIDGEGNVAEVVPTTQGSIEKSSPLETLVREQLQKVNGSADSPDNKQRFVNRICHLLRGSDATLEELQSVSKDLSPQWRENAQQRIAAAIPPQQIEFLNSHRCTVPQIFSELAQQPASIPSAGLYRIEEEWIRRLANAQGIGKIHGTIRSIRDGQNYGCRATIVLEPRFRLLLSNTPGGWFSSRDSSRRTAIETDESGRFQFEKLSKGEYLLTITSPGMSSTERTIHLANHEAVAESNITVSAGDTIAGTVEDGEGNIIPNAKVTAIKRFAFPDNPNSYTTGNLPKGSATTSEIGEFLFEALFEGDFVFEVTAEGYESATTERIPAGSTDVKIRLSRK